MIPPLWLVSAAALVAPAPAAVNPWFGTWSLRLKSADEKPETLVYSDAGGGAMRMVSVEDNSIIVTRFDGQPAKDQGAKAGVEQTLAVKALSPTSYSWTFARDGKPIAQGINTLAADAKSFTEIAWSVADPTKRFTLVYERR